MNQSEPTRQNPHPLANYQFSSEELRVLRECNTESFFQRSLPFGTALGVAAFLSMKNGVLKPSVKYGMTPKILVSVIIGYFLGKFSYQEKCAQKLMMLPNSTLGGILKQRKQGGVIDRFTTEQNLGVGLALSPFNSSSSDATSENNVLGRNPNSALNLDTDVRPHLKGLDDIYRPSLDSNTLLNEPEIPIEPVAPGTSYEELRKKNREEYALKQQNPFNRPLPDSAPIVVRSSSSGTNYEDKAKVQANKYGDVWTE